MDINAILISLRNIAMREYATIPKMANVVSKLVHTTVTESLAEPGEFATSLSTG
jgi:hypothetical protein